MRKVSLAQATNHTPSELFQQWQSSPREEEIKPQTQELATVANRIGPSGSETQHPQNHTSREPTRSKEEQSNQHNVHVSQAMNTQKTSDGNPAQNVARNPDMHRVSSNQQAATAAHAANRPAGKQVPFGMLLPVIEAQLDRDRAVQLQTLYARLRSNTINKEEFVRHVRALVGDHMLKTEIYRLQQGQVPAPARQNTQRASSTLQSSDASALAADQRPRLLERQSDSHGGQASHASNANVSAINYHQQQLQQQHMNLPQPSFPTYGNTGGNFHPSASTNMDKPTPSYKHQSHGLQMRQGPVNPAMATQAMSQHDLNDMKRFHGGGHAHFTSNSALQQNSGHWQASMHKDQGLMSSNPYAKSDSEDQMNDQQHRSQLSTPDGLEHATRGPGSSKHDTFEAMFSRLGSITAQLERQNAAAAAAANSSLASGGNAKTPPKKPIVGQKKPLEAPVNPLSKKQKVVGEFADQSIEKLNDVTAVSGVNLRRVNLERPRHRTVITSDVRKQIMSMNQKAREEWEKKQAEVEKFQRADEPEGSGDGDDGYGKSLKVNKEQDDKMRTQAANVAARAAVGGDDMLSNWQLMAEQAHQTREGGANSASTSHPSVDVWPKPMSTSERTLNDNQDTEKTSALATVTVTPASLAQTTNHTPSEIFQQRQSFTHEEEVKPQTQEPATVVTRIGPSCSETQHPQNHTSRELNQPKEDQTNQNNVQASQSMNTRNTSDRNPDMHRVSSNPQAAAAELSAKLPSRKQVPIALLLPVIIPQLDKDRAMQLQGHYARLRSNSISTKEFCRHMQAVVGDHMLKKEIYKLQQGKDETMHPGAHVEAFTAAVNRDTEGDNKNTDNANIINSVTEKPPTTTTTVVATTSRASLALATNHTPSELFQQWQSSTCEEEVKPQTQEPATVVNRIGPSGLDTQHPQNHTSRELTRPSGSDTQHPQNHTSRELTRPKEDQANQHNVHVSQAMNIQNASDRNSAQIIARNPDMHRVSGNQQAAAAAALAANCPSSKLVLSALLLPVIIPQLDKYRAMQLQGHYARLKNNSISREEFVRHMRILVGDHMLKMAFYKLQHHWQVPVEHNAQSASSSLESDARTLPADQRPRLLERQSDSHRVQSSHVSNANVSAINQQRQKQPQKQQQQQQQPQQHMNFPHLSFPTYGDPMCNMAVDNLQISADACPHYPHNHHHHHRRHLMDPSQIIAHNLDNELQRTNIMNSNQQGANATNRPSGKGVTFAMLLQFLEPQLDKDRNVQLQGLFARLMNNSINKEEFVRHMITLVGDHTLRMAVRHLRSCNKGEVPIRQNV